MHHRLVILIENSKGLPHAFSPVAGFVWDYLVHVGIGTECRRHTGLRFPGQWRDGDSDRALPLTSALRYNYFRDYDPVTGRYLQPDPIGLAGGRNVYAYTAGNPSNYVDPDGLNWLKAADRAVKALSKTRAGQTVEKYLDKTFGAINNTARQGYQSCKGWYDLKFGKFSNRALQNSGKDLDRNGLTKAGRALQKHGDRSATAFPRSSGSAAMRNQQGQKILEEILKNPNRVTKYRADKGIDVTDKISGRGVRFTRHGKLKGFIEPKR